MKIKLFKELEELLFEMNKISNSAIFGGYIRDKMLNLESSDVDIVTNVKIEQIRKRWGKKEKYGERKSVHGHDIASFKLKGEEKIFVEIIFSEEDINKKSEEADFTINSMLYDGEKIIDLNNGLKDIKNKEIKYVRKEILNSDYKTRKMLWLKTIRLSVTTGFEIDKKTMEILINNKKSFEGISDEIKSNEGHKMINNLNVIKIFELLNKTQILENDIKEFKINENYLYLKKEQKLCALAIQTSKKLIDDYIEIFKFKNDLKEKYELLYENFKEETTKNNKIKQQIKNIRKSII